jgi:actin-like ATPase involved in cell morphogenesis
VSGPLPHLLMDASDLSCVAVGTGLALEHMDSLEEP